LNFVTINFNYFTAETWIKYSGVENITADGVFGGYYDSSPVYVGQVINNSRPNPVWIQPDPNGGYCIKNDDADCRKDFKFLREPVDLVYKWTESANGELKENDVKMGDTGTIARLQKYEKIHIGIVYPRSGFMSVHTEFSFIVDGYEVLRCFEGDFITKTSTEISTPDTTISISDSTITMSDMTTTFSDTTTTLSDTTTLIDTTTISTTTATPFVTVSVFTRPTIAVPASTVPITPPTSENSGQDAELKGIYQGLNQAYGLIDNMSGLINRMFESVTIMSDAAHQTHEQIKSLTNYCQQNKC